MTTRLVGGLCWLVLAVASLHAISRQLFRTAALPWLTSEPGLALAVCLLAGLVLIVGLRQRARTVVFATALACGLTVQLSVGARLQSDAFYYYAYLRSVAFDGDVSLANDYRMIGLGDKPHLFEPTATGYAHSAWTVGPAIVWAPFFAGGHLAAMRLAATGHDVAVDGSSYPYRQSIVIAGLVYALLGWWLILALCETWFTTRVAAAAVALTAGGSFMLWYTLVEPTMTHAPSMAATAAFMLWWSRTRSQRSWAAWVGLGLLAGLMTLIRWQNLLFVVVPAVDAVVMLIRAWRASDRETQRHVWLGGLLFTITAAASFVPQLLAWKAIYGSYLAVSPVGPQIRLLAPEIELTMFSSRNGLVAMSPILYIGLAGLLIFFRRHAAIAGPLVLATGAMIWFNASIQDWWGSDGFGGRRFDGVIPIAVIGLAAALDQLSRWAVSRPRWVVTIAAAALIAWNLTFMATAQAGHVRLGEAINFGDVSGEQARVWHGWIGHPFSYPANLWFAARNGVSPASYDLLGPAMFLGDPLRPTGRIDVGGEDGLLLGEGWFGVERDGDTTFRWAGSRAQLLLPLDHAAPLTIEVRARAFHYAGAEVQRLTVVVDGTGFGPFEVPAGWTSLSFDTPVDVWRAGLNRVELIFSRSVAPRAVGLGGDDRSLAAAVDVFRVTKR